MPRMWFDTHCHLDSENCPDGADAVLARAHAAGVGHFVCIGVGSESAQRQAVELSERDENVWATVGVHPHDAAQFDAASEHAFRELLSRPRVVALGEVG